MILNNMGLKLIVFLTLIIMTVSCGFSGGQIPADHYYRLPEATADKQSASKYDTILLNPIQVEGIYHERSILYVEQASPLEMQRYHYHYWVETPASLLRKYAYSYLGKSGIAQNISLNAIPHPADIETAITITNFERIIEKGNDQILVSLRVMTKYNKDSQQALTRLYTANVPAASSSMHATVEAFGRALNQIMAAYVTDLNQ